MVRFQQTMDKRSLDIDRREWNSEKWERIGCILWHDCGEPKVDFCTNLVSLADMESIVMRLSDEVRRVIDDANEAAEIRRNARNE